MTTSPDNPAHDIVELLSADRELTPEEITFLLETAKGEWWRVEAMAAGMTVERTRLREAWLDVEKASGQEYIDRMEIFRGALGIE